VAHIGLELKILLPLYPECWYHKSLLAQLLLLNSNKNIFKNTQQSRCSGTHLYFQHSGGCIRSRPAWTTKQVPNQERLYKETLSQKTKQNNNIKKQYVMSTAAIFTNVSI
jgi:hypothetical protein